MATWQLALQLVGLVFILTGIMLGRSQSLEVLGRRMSTGSSADPIRVRVMPSFLVRGMHASRRGGKLALEERRRGSRPPAVSARGVHRRDEPEHLRA
jgi:hypothetical protein